MASPLFADISSYQTVSNWSDYYYWSRSGDGFARVVVKATEGVGFKDSKFDTFFSTAIANGVWMTNPYHYARPDLNPGATGAANEARWFASVVSAVGLGPQDILMLDLEQNESAAWAHAFHDALAAAITLHNKPVLYDSASHFQQFFAADLALAAKFDCALAAWHPISQGIPAAPPGWRMLWWQYTDRENVPGIGVCDANLWLGGSTMVPAGPFVSYTFGKEIPPTVSWQALAPQYGISESDLLAIPGNSVFAPYDNNPAHVQGMSINLPGFPQPAGTAKLVIDADSIHAVIA